MFGPGDDVPDPTEGMIDLKDLPRCGHRASRHKTGQRTFHDLGDVSTGCPVDLLGTSSSHSGSPCRKSCHINLTDVAPPGSHSTHRVMPIAVRLVVEDGLPDRPTSWHLWRDHRVFVPCAPMQNWAEAGRKKERSV